MQEFFVRWGQAWEKWDWTFRGGKVIYYEDFESEQEALKAAGLRE